MRFYYQSGQMAMRIPYHDELKLKCKFKLHKVLNLAN